MEETTTAKNVKSGETSASKENHKRNKQGRSDMKERSPGKQRKSNKCSRIQSGGTIYRVVTGSSLVGTYLPD